MTVSEEGLVEAYRKGYRMTEDGRCISPRGKFLSLDTKNSSGYRVFKIKYKGKLVHVGYHRLQAYQKFGFAMFEEGIIVRHLDDNKLNNSKINIDIGTQKDNMKDIPQYKKVERLKNRKPVNRNIPWHNIEIDKEAGYTYKQLTIKYGVGVDTLSYHFTRRKDLKTS